MPVIVDLLSTNFLIEKAFDTYFYIPKQKIILFGRRRNITFYMGVLFLWVTYRFIERVLLVHQLYRFVIPSVLARVI